MIRIAPALVALALVAGCAAPVARPFAPPPEMATRAMVADVPLIKQADFYCGPASLAMTMQWAGRDISQTDIASRSFTPGAAGTFQADMLGAIRRQGMMGVELSSLEDLLAEVAAGHPVIVFQNLGLNWAPRWHYGVVVGYDLAKDAVVLNSGQYDRMVMPLRLFRRTWARGGDWAVVVLPADRLPAMADQWAIAEAAAGLERAGQAATAATAYRSGQARWPGNWIWPYGLGNALYAQGDLTGARTALRRAVALAPDAPEPRNNLAHVEEELAGS